MNFMTMRVPLGRWFGVAVSLDWTFFLAVLYFMRGTSSVELGAMGVAVLFGIVLLHEFGHAAACRLTGGKAHEIELGALGGVTYSSPPPKAWAHLVTTAGGPAVHVVLIPVLWALAHYWVLPMALEGNDTLAMRAVVLGMNINVVLLLLNMLPVYPLDGGKIVQEILWMVIGYPRSLEVSGMVGTVGGIAMIGLGLGLVTIAIPVPLLGKPIELGNGVSPILAFVGLSGVISSWMVYQRARAVRG